MGYLKVTVSAIVGKDFNNGKLTFTIRDCDADKRWNVIKIADVSFAEFMKAYEGVSQDDIKKWFIHDCCELKNFLSANNISYTALGKWGNKYIPYSRQLFCRRMNHTFKNWGIKNFAKKRRQDCLVMPKMQTRNILNICWQNLTASSRKQTQSVS